MFRNILYIILGLSLFGCATPQRDKVKAEYPRCMSDNVPIYALLHDQITVMESVCVGNVKKQKEQEELNIKYEKEKKKREIERQKEEIERNEFLMSPEGIKHTNDIKSKCNMVINDYIIKSNKNKYIYMKTSNSWDKSGDIYYCFVILTYPKAIGNGFEKVNIIYNSKNGLYDTTVNYM